MRFHGILTLLIQAKPGAALPASAVLRRSCATFELGAIIELTAHSAAQRVFACQNMTQIMAGQAQTCYAMRTGYVSQEMYVSHYT